MSDDEHASMHSERKQKSKRKVDAEGSSSGRSKKMSKTSPSPVTKEDLKKLEAGVHAAAADSDEDQDEQKQAIMNSIMDAAEQKDTSAPDTIVAYDGMSQTKISSGKQSSKGASTAAASSESDDSGSGSESDDDADDDPSSGFLVPRAPAKFASTLFKEPTQEEFLNPNNTLRWFSVKHRLKVHYSELNPKTLFRVYHAAPDPAKNSYTKSYFTIQSTVDQKFDFKGGSKPMSPKFRMGVFIGPFMVTKFPRMWPYGDRFALKGSKFAAPDDDSKIKFKLPLTTLDYSASLGVTKDNYGIVDADADVFMSRFMRGGVDRWAKEESWRKSQVAFPIRRKAAAELADNELQSRIDEWEERYGKKKKKNKEVPPKPALTSEQKDAITRKKFLEQIKPSVHHTAEKPYDHINTAAPLLITQSAKDRKEGKKPVLHSDEWIRRQFTHPKPFVDKKKQEGEEGRERPGFPRLLNDIPMYRGVGVDEAVRLYEQGSRGGPPYRLVPPECRHVVDSDVVAPIIGLEVFDTQPGSGFRQVLLGLIWIGERNTMDENALQRKMDEYSKLDKPFPKLDPSTYFQMAQPYTRTKDFKAETVENSANYQAAGNNASASSAAAPAASSSEPPEFEGMLDDEQLLGLVEKDESDD